MAQDSLFCDIYYKLSDILTTQINQEQDNSYQIINYIDETDMDNPPINTDNTNIIFNINIFITQILNSYKYNTNNILNQFKLDFPRTTILINNTIISTIEQFNYLITLYLLTFSTENVYIINSYTYNYLTLAKLLCTQSSYAFPYIYLYKLHQLENKNYMLCSLHENRNINFNLPISNSNNKVSLEAQFAIKDISTNETIKVIHMVLTINLENNTDSPFGELGLLNWKYIN